MMGWDRVYQFQPWLEYNVRTIREGEFPLWNASSAMGTPHLALDQTAVLDPLSTGAGLLVGAEHAGTARALLSILIIGLGTLMFARRRGLSPPAGLLAALAVAFGGWFILWQGRPMSAAAAWLPWILWAGDRLLHRGRPATDSLLVAAFVALSFFAGHIETTAHILVAAAVFIGFEAWRGPRLNDGGRIRLDSGPRVRSGALGIGALVAGIGLACALILPLAAFLLGDAGGPGIRGGPPLSFGGSILAGLAGASSLQTMFGTAVTAFVPVLNFQGVLPFSSPSPNLAENTIYIGVVPFILALYGLVHGGKEAYSPSRIWAAAALLALAIALQLPIIHLFAQLPAIRWTNVARFRFLYAFAMSMAAAYGLGVFCRDRHTRTRWAWVGAPLLALGATITWNALAGADAEALRRAMAGWAAGGVFLLVGARAPARWIPGIAVALTAVELTFALGGVQPSVPAEDVYPETPVTAFFEQYPDARIAGYPLDGRRPLAGAIPLAYGIQSIGSYNVLYSERMRILMEEVNRGGPGHNRLGPDWLVLDDPGDPLVDLLGVRFIVTATGVPARRIRESGIMRQFPRVVKRTDRVLVAENPDPLPGAFLVHGVRWVDGAERAAAVLGSSGFDFRRTAVVELPEHMASPAPLSVSARPRTAEVTLRRPSAGELIVHTRSDRPGFLVITEAYNSGWRAERDGRTVPVYPADVAFMGVTVPAGENRIILRYEPVSFQLGAAISVITLIGLLALVWRERKRP